MNVSEKKKVFIVMAASGAAFAINYLINFFLTPFITQNLGTDAYGYVTLAKTIAYYAVIITTALNSYAARFITIEYHKEDYEKANVYFNSVFFADLFIGGALLVFAILFSGIATFLLNVPEQLRNDVKKLIVFVFLNLFISTGGTVFQAASYIKNKLDVANVIKGISYVVEAAILLALYTSLTPQVYYVGIALCVATIVIVVSNIIITQRYTENLKIDIKRYRYDAVKELVISGIWNSLNSLGNVLNSGLDLLVCAVMLTPVAMGQVSIAKSINSIFTGLYSMAATPFHPLFLKKYACGDKNGLIDQLVFSMKISGLVSNLAFAGFCALGKVYYKLWIPDQDIELIYVLSVISVLSGVLDGAITPLFYIYTLTVKNKIPCLITITGGILNVLGMYVLVKYTNMGVYSIVITTAVIMLFIEGVTNPIYMSRCLSINAGVIYKPLFLHIVSCLVMTVMFRFIAIIVAPTTWIGLIVAAVLMVVMGVVIHFGIVFGFKKFFSKVGEKIK